VEDKNNPPTTSQGNWNWSFLEMRQQQQDLSKRVAAVHHADNLDSKKVKTNSCCGEAEQEKLAFIKAEKQRLRLQDEKAYVEAALKFKKKQDKECCTEKEQEILASIEAQKESLRLFHAAEKEELRRLDELDDLRTQQERERFASAWLKLGNSLKGGSHRTAMVQTTRSSKEWLTATPEVKMQESTKVLQQLQKDETMLQQSGPEDDFLYGATKVRDDAVGMTIGPNDVCGLRCDYCNAPCVRPTNLAPQQPHLYHACGNHMPRRMPTGSAEEANEQRNLLKRKCHKCGTPWPDRASEAEQEPFKCQCGTMLMSFYDPQASTGPDVPRHCNLPPTQNFNKIKKGSRVISEEDRIRYANMMSPEDSSEGETASKATRCRSCNCNRWANSPHFTTCCQACNKGRTAHTDECGQRQAAEAAKVMIQWS
jgi:hypothetical protein